MDYLAVDARTGNDCERLVYSAARSFSQNFCFFFFLCVGSFKFVFPCIIGAFVNEITWQRILNKYSSWIVDKCHYVALIMPPWPSMSVFSLHGAIWLSVTMCAIVCTQGRPLIWKEPTRDAWHKEARYHQCPNHGFGCCKVDCWLKYLLSAIHIICQDKWQLSLYASELLFFSSNGACLSPVVCQVSFSYMLLYHAGCMAQGKRSYKWIPANSNA